MKSFCVKVRRFATVFKTPRSVSSLVKNISGKMVGKRIFAQVSSPIEKAAIYVCGLHTIAKIITKIPKVMKKYDAFNAVMYIPRGRDIMICVGEDLKKVLTNSILRIIMA